jgi:LDH2 family malate/lactate/ureidoglycolate dehydrogenase
VETKSERYVDPRALRGLMRDLLVSAGCPGGAAADTTDVLIEADLRGYPFEGCMHLAPLLRDLRKGRVKATAQPRILEERPGSALVDGDGGASPVGGLFAAAVAVRKAQTSGCCAVGVVNTDPLYMLGYVVDRIAQAGLVGIAMSAGRPRVHPPGGIDPILGTNPVAIALPTESDTPLVVDFATSSLAFGAVGLARRRGERLPAGAAIGPDGQPTNDPAVATEGALSAFGGHKGFALALCVGLLAGPLVGAAVGEALGRPAQRGRRTNRGALLLAEDPASFGEPAEFRRAVSAHLREIKGSRRSPGVTEIRIPGDRSRTTRRQRLRDGVPIDPSVLHELETLAREWGVPFRELACRGDPARTASRRPATPA